MPFPNYTAITNPVVTSDTNAGYSAGSVWVNTVLDLVFVCLDATAGAAVWGSTAVIIGTDVQAWDADLDALAGLTSAANKIPMFSGAGAATVIDLLDEDDLVSDSASAVPTQQSVKAYVDGSGTPIWLETKIAAADATIDFTTGIDATYDSYVIEVIDLITATDGASLLLRTSTDAGATFDNGASDYKYVGQRQEAGVGSVDYSSSGDTKLLIADALSNTKTFNAVLKLYNPSAAHTTVLDWCSTYLRGSTGNIRYTFGSGSREAAADVDALSFLAASGNITSGIFKLYGIK